MTGGEPELGTDPAVIIGEQRAGIGALKAEVTRLTALLTSQPSGPAEVDDWSLAAGEAS